VSAYLRQYVLGNIKFDAL